MDVSEALTDLAAERVIPTGEEELKGITTSNYNKRGFAVTDITVLTDEAAGKLGKPKGRYVSVEAFDEDKADAFALALADVIKSFFKVHPKSVLVCGLGNRNITPDALGSRTADKINVTRVLADVAGVKAETEVSAVSPGVLGITGIETAEILQGICDKIKPDAVVVIDSLCARDVHRIASTVQLTDSGIKPGRGLKNNRSVIDSTALDTFVLSIGVPTVVYAKTICHNVLELLARNDGSYNEKAVENVMSKLDDNVLSELVVTPKDIDDQIEKISSALAGGINIALGTDKLF